MAQAETVIVYELLVAKRHTVRGADEDSPVGTRRIVALYTLDIEGVHRTKAAIKHAMNQWETALTDFRTRCRRHSEETNDIVVMPMKRAN